MGAMKARLTVMVPMKIASYVYKTTYLITTIHLRAPVKSPLICGSAPSIASRKTRIACSRLGSDLGLERVPRGKNSS